MRSLGPRLRRPAPGPPCAVLCCRAISGVVSGSAHSERREMPLFMDTHRNVEGLTAEAVADAHKKDLETQEKHGVKYHKYWFNEDEGLVHCLVEAPNKEAAEAVHREASGLVADEIVEVQEGS